MSALSARASLACPHLKLNFEASASEIAAKSAALVAGLDAAVARIASGASGDAGADWIGATDAVAAASAERAHGDAGVYAALRAQAPATRGGPRRSAPRALFANGLGWATRPRDVAAVRAELGQLCAAFEQAINVDASYVSFAEAELEGLSPAAIAALPSRDGGATRDVPVPGERRALNRIVELGRAALLGAENHAAAALASKMAATPATVHGFLDRVASKLRPLRDRDLARLLEKKRLEHPGAARVDAWDVAYYSRQIKADLGIDEESLKPFFPMDRVVPAAIRALGVLGFSVDGPLADARLWHEDVDLYAIRDGATMVVPLRPAAGESPNACAVLGNMGDAAGFMRFREVETLLHELGHVFHALAGDAKPAILSWAWPMVPWPGGVEMDFLEVPSMLCQQWVYAAPMLAKLASRAADGSEIPADVVAALAESRHLLAGVGNARYLSMCAYDMAMHSSAGAVDVVKLYGPLVREYSNLEEIDGTHFASSWYHMAIGYDCAYYGYLWSEIYAVDAYARFGDALDARQAAAPDPARAGAAEPGATMIANPAGRPTRRAARLGVAPKSEAKGFSRAGAGGAAAQRASAGASARRVVDVDEDAELGLARVELGLLRPLVRRVADEARGDEQAGEVVGRRRRRGRRRRWGTRARRPRGAPP
ncbi:metalloendopeptidase [Aureococcus anophagefferens]|nr:metalloendopeptidase [Aureococcus anophagefferens]